MERRFICAHRHLLFAYLSLVRKFRRFVAVLQREIHRCALNLEQKIIRNGLELLKKNHFGHFVTADNGLSVQK